MKKILHIINYYHEGFGYQENYLPVCQKNLGYQVKVLTSDYYFPFPNYDDSVRNILGDRKVGVGIFDDKGIEIIRKKSLFSSIFPAGILYFSIGSTIKEFKPDFIHVHGATNLWLFNVVRLQKKIDYKIFIDSHQDFVVESYKNSNFFYQLFYFFWTNVHYYLIKFSIVAKYLPITKASQSWLVKRLNIPISNQIVSPLGTDLSLMNYNEVLDSDFRKTHKADNKLIIVNAGKQYEGKHILFIIEIAHQLQLRGVDLLLVLVGSAPDNYDKKITKKLASLSSESWLRFPLMARSKLKEIYCAADLGIWPGVPSNTIQEAMGCGVAMALPNDNSTNHLIDGNGLHISIDDILGTTEKLLGIVKTANLLLDMKKKSIVIARNYSWDSISKDLIKIYEY
jgi:glycosyltransferase involved in cell wall biosynthesis